MDLTKLPTGKNPPNEVYAFIEIPQGSTTKYELDKEMGVILADRFHYTAMPYPFSYGFIPGTLSPDGDPLDVMVISSNPVAQGTMVAVRPIGMLEMKDEAGDDAKIIAVPTKKVDPFFARIETVDDIDEATKKLIQHFFDHYKELEPNKWVKTTGFLAQEKALSEIEEGMKAATK